MDTATLATNHKIIQPNWHGLSKHGRTDEPFWTAVNAEITALSVDKSNRTNVGVVVNRIQAFEDFIMGLPASVLSDLTAAVTTGALATGLVTKTVGVKIKTTVATATDTLLTALDTSNTKLQLPMSEIKVSVNARTLTDADANAEFTLVVEKAN